MRAVVQRVSRARVIVESRVTAEIGVGLMILLGLGCRCQYGREGRAPEDL